MKILVVTQVWSFIQDAVDLWRKRGDTVIQSPNYSADLAKQVDVIFFEFIDKEIGKAVACPIGRKKKIIARLHRCEYYLQMIPKATDDWSKVDTLIITGKYFYDLITNGPLIKFIGNKTKIVHYGYGISKDKFTFRKRVGLEDKFFENKPVKIGWFAKNYDGRKDPVKAISCFYAIAKHFPHRNFEMHMAAGGAGRGIPEYIRYLLSTHPLLENKITMNRGQREANPFYEPMDYFLNTSNNESFCCVIAEAAMKGIKPLLWDFESADRLWPREWTFFSDEEMFKILENVG